VGFPNREGGAFFRREKEHGMGRQDTESASEHDKQPEKHCKLLTFANIANIEAQRVRNTPKPAQAKKRPIA